MDSGHTIPISSPQEREKQALLHEGDLQLRSEGLFSLASRMERASEESEAAAIYQKLNEEVSAKVREKAAARLRALEGGGAFGLRCEAFSRNFIRHAADPAALAAMTFAGGVYNLAEFGALHELLSAPAGILTRGGTARTLASLIGFGAEGLAFAAANRLGGASPEEVSWGAELGHSYLSLGALKLGNWGAGQAFKLLPSAFSTVPALQLLFPQSAMLAGILLSQKLEAWAGIGGEASLTQGFLTLLHFNVAGALTKSFLGARFSAWKREIDLRFQNGQLPGSPSLLSLTPSFAVTRGGSAPSDFGRDPSLTPLWSKGSGRRNGPEAAARPIQNSGRDALLAKLQHQTGNRFTVAELENFVYREIPDFLISLRSYEQKIFLDRTIAAQPKTLQMIADDGEFRLLVFLRTSSQEIQQIEAKLILKFFQRLEPKLPYKGDPGAIDLHKIRELNVVPFFSPSLQFPFERYGIGKIGGLLDLAKSKGLAMPDLTGKSLREIHESMARVAETILKDWPPARPPRSDQPLADPIMVQWAWRPIEHLDLNNRSINGLQHANISTIGDLVALSATQLLAIKNLGSLSLQNIEHALGKIGLRSKPGNLSSEPAHPSAVMSPVVEEIMAKPIEELGLSNRSYNFLKQANILTVRDLVGRTKRDVLEIKNLGRGSLKDIESALEKFGVSLGMLERR